MTKNLLLQLCDELHISHTLTFTNRFFEEHPYRYSLFGLANMLEAYGVKTCGVKFTNKVSALADINTPFIAQMSDDLVMVTAIKKKEIIYQWYNETVHISLEQFKVLWSGISLLIVSTENAIEPHYKEHRKLELINKAKIWGAIGCISLILGIAIIQRSPPNLTPQWLYINWSLRFPIIFLNCIGICLCYLLLLQQLNISNVITDQLCNLQIKATCKDLINTNAAKIVYGISWSELGMAYFGVNLTALLIFPKTIPYLCLFSFAAIFFTAWSLWYQRFLAHIWCTLCLMVQAVFIIQAFFYLFNILFTSNLSFSLFSIHYHLIPLLLSYFTATLIVNIIMSFISKAGQAEKWRNDLRSLILKQEVFDALLVQEKHYEINVKSAVHFGNINAPYRLTILTNPYCSPCADMHARFLDISQTNCYIEMIFVSFHEKYDRVCRLLIAAYLQLGANRAWHLYEEWYRKGKNRQESFFQGLELDQDSNDVKHEYNEHIKWRKKTGLNATPTLLVNGYSMPQSYRIEDFIDMTKKMA